MRDDNINRYFHDVERQPMLTMEEEFRVGMEAQAGDEKAITNWSTLTLGLWCQLPNSTQATRNR